MTKHRKLNPRSRPGRNPENGNGTQLDPVNQLAPENNELPAFSNNLGMNEEFEKFLTKLEAGEFDSDSNVQLLFQEYQKVIAGSTAFPDETNAVSEANRKLARLNDQLHHEIIILKTELENMKQSAREQTELQQLVETYKTALVEKEALLQELDQRLQFLSLRLQEIPLLSLAPENSGYRMVRARLLANTILPDFYKKRLSMELDLVEKIETEEADTRLLELNLMRELIYFHETELKQLLKN
jgi:hypothetical protein